MNFPRDYSYCLFNVKVSDIINKDILAVTPEHALQRLNMSSGEVNPVMAIHCIQKMGHQRTHDYFKSFGNEWSLKDGYVFYK